VYHNAQLDPYFLKQIVLVVVETSQCVTLGGSELLLNNNLVIKDLK
jgi:hypothetical protein